LDWEAGLSGGGLEHRLGVGDRGESRGLREGAALGHKQDRASAEVSLTQAPGEIAAGETADAEEHKYERAPTQPPPDQPKINVRFSNRSHETSTQRQKRSSGDYGKRRSYTEIALLVPHARKTLEGTEPPS